MTEVFRWSPVFETGFAEVDVQHRTLIKMINDAAPVLADPNMASESLLENLLDHLIAYATQHFQDEERLMVSKQLHPEYILSHIQQHRDFASEVAAMRAHTTGEKTDSVSLLRFLTSWLAFHILGVDQQMAEQIRCIDRGANARDAVLDAGETRDTAAVKPLLEALTSLYQVISSRNRALKEANRSLEEKVTERTAELAREKNTLAAFVRKMELTQSQLLQSEKMASIGQLAAGVAHEINNPVGFVNSNLGTLKTYAERLLELLDTYGAMESSLPDDPELLQTLADAKSRADLTYLREDIIDLIRESQEGLSRVKRIVADLKDFSHVDEAEWQDADINAGLESTLNVVWNELKYKAEVVRNFAPLPFVRCLAAQINQVFMNLLVNAAQAIDTHGTITITTCQEDDYAVIRIADNGKGIPHEIQQRIFEPFFTTKPVGKGTGLGLSIAWDIVKKHRGQLAVDSTPDVGTTFTIRIPIEGPDAPSSQGTA